MTNVQRPASFHLRVGQADEITVHIRVHLFDPSLC
jgi:hypothetical protein